MAGSISVTGLSTGLDTSSIVSKMIELKRRPIDVISAKKDFFDLKLSEFQELNTKLLSFQGVVQNLSTSDKFTTKNGSFSNNNSTDNNNVVSLTASSTAASSSYTLVVDSLAKADKEVSDGFAATTSAVSTGTFKITVGSTTTSITIDSSSNTLEGLKTAINSSGADVTASILNDGSSTNPYRLVITSKSTGTDNAVSTSGLNILFSETQTATNASFTLDGISITKSSNTITDVIDGVTVDLDSVGSGTITIESDVANVKSNIQTFVSEYNKLVAFINEQMFIDTATGETGILFGNPTVIDLQSTMRDIVADEVSGLTGTFTTLAQVGITTNSVLGNLEIDDADLTDAITEDIDAVSNLFIASGSSDTTGLSFVGFTEDTEGGTYDIRVSDGTVQIADSGSSDFVDATGSDNYYTGPSGENSEGLRFRIDSLSDGDKGSITFSLGVAANFDRILDNLTDQSKEGPLRSELDTLTDNIEEIEDSIEDQENRLILEEDSLTREFAALEALVSKLQTQGDFLSQISSGLVASAKQ